MVGHTPLITALGRQTGGSLSWRPRWSTKWVRGQPEKSTQRNLILKANFKVDQNRRIKGIDTFQRADGEGCSSHLGELWKVTIPRSTEKSRVPPVLSARGKSRLRLSLREVNPQLSLTSFTYELSVISSLPTVLPLFPSYRSGNGILELRWDS